MFTLVACLNPTIDSMCISQTENHNMVLTKHRPILVLYIHDTPYYFYKKHWKHGFTSLRFPLPPRSCTHVFLVSTYGTQISVMDAERGVDLRSSLNRSATLMLISGTLKPAFFPSLSLSPTPQPWVRRREKKPSGTDGRRNLPVVAIAWESAKSSEQ